MILNSRPVLAFVKKNAKFIDCDVYTEITSNVVCKVGKHVSIKCTILSMQTVPGLSDGDLTSSTFLRSLLEEFKDIEIIEDNTEAEVKAQERVLKGDACEFIKLCDINRNSGCSHGKQRYL